MELVKQAGPVPQVQTPAWHRLPEPSAVQLKQAWPPVPQMVVVLPGWQTPLASQQPFGQLVASHLQPLFVQRWPFEQVAQLFGGLTLSQQVQAPLAQVLAIGIGPGLQL